MKSQRVREQRGGVPDIEELRKAEEDKNYGVWEKYLVKTSEVEKSKQRILKRDAALRKEKQEKNEQKMQEIKQNNKQNQLDRHEKASEINEKFRNMDIKIDHAN